jgi:preprotein translocase subunit YajC
MDFLPILLLMGRKQKRQQQAQQDLQNSLEIGDRVMTTSGLYGNVSDVSDSTTIGIEIAPGVETEWLRAAVREKVGPVVEDDDEVEDDASDEADEELVNNEPPPVADDEDDADADKDTAKDEAEVESSKSK